MKRSLSHLARFTRKLRSAENTFEKLQAVTEFEKHMEQVELDYFEACKIMEVIHLGKTAD